MIGLHIARQLRKEKFAIILREARKSKDATVIEAVAWFDEKQKQADTAKDESE